MMAPSVFVDVGYVARAHGVRGTLWLHWHDGDVPFESFPPQLQLTAPSGLCQVFDVKAQRRHKRGSLVDFVELATVDDAQQWKGAAVRVSEKHLPQEQPGEIYLYRLMGAECRDQHQRLLGTLAHIYNHGASIVLGIAPPGAASGEGALGAKVRHDELLVPLLETTLRRRHAATSQQPQRLDLELLPDYFAP